MKKPLILAIFALTFLAVPLAARAIDSSDTPDDSPAEDASVTNTPVKSAKESGNWIINASLTRPRKLYCTQAKMIDRLRCRLSMSAEEIAQEYSIQFLPEDCRALAKKLQPACVADYKAIVSCHDSAVGAERDACVRAALEIPSSLSDAYDACANAGTVAKKKSCQAAVQSDAIFFAKYKLADLVTRADDTRTHGSDINPLVSFDSTMTSLLSQFNKATSAKVREQVFAKARSAWKTFTKTVPDVSPEDNLDDGLDALRSIQ